ncbi:hypothetical protein [Litchfieldella rifensis]|uniref:Uncharacterized protein n=1 Tax=Litchfieldella rifensis TaxID=762643 RepID=A0ABV7LPC7_9GAMM
MTVDLAMPSVNAMPVCGDAFRVPLAECPVWYWSYWFSAGVPAARSC